MPLRVEGPGAAGAWRRWHLLVLTVAVTAAGAVPPLTGAAVSPQTSAVQADTLPARPWVIAHRGASAYAPENTLPAFATAIEQRATFIEIDVQRTKDGAIVCLHDVTLDRTTDVARRFPDRGRPPATPDGPRFFLEDFTLAEVRQLDAGQWFGATFVGTQVPTLAETIAAVRGRAGLFIELKAPERYPGIERQVLDHLRTAGLDRPGADPATPIVVQSFTAASLETFARLDSGLPIHLLFGPADAARWLTPDGLTRARTFATGLSPEKGVLRTHSADLRDAQRAGLPITPWTFRLTPSTTRADLTAEMAHHHRSYGVDGWITDNPDLAPRVHRRAPTRR